MRNKIILLVIIIIFIIIFWTQVKVGLINAGLLPTANYKFVLPKLEKWEGGISNNPNDTGGFTNKGITIGTWSTLAPKLLGIAGTTSTLSAMNNSQWETIVKYYWDKVSGDEIQNQGVANLLFDSYWNSGWYGPQRMVIYFNKVYGTNFNTSANQSLITKDFINAVNSKNGYEVCELFWKSRKEHYEAIVNANPSQRIQFNESDLAMLNEINKYNYSETNNFNQRVFLNGWLNRLNDYKCSKTLI